MKGLKGSNMRAGSDILIYDQHDQPILAVEVKNKIDASVEWATRLRRNFLAHGLIPDTEYFLVITPHKLFIWGNTEANSRSSKPTLVVDAQPLLAPYFEQTAVTPEDISGSSFELIVRAWLTELMYTKVQMNQLDDSTQWVADIGLKDVLERGYLGQEVLA